MVAIFIHICATEALKRRITSYWAESCSIDTWHYLG